MDYENNWQTQVSEKLFPFNLSEARRLPKPLFRDFDVIRALFFIRIVATYVGSHFLKEEHRVLEVIANWSY
jgi:hypothetical protein